MAERKRKGGESVPTLTEVVELRAGPAPAQPVSRIAAANELTAEVLFELESRIDSHFDARLRDLLAPALARVAEGFIRESRGELAVVLRAMVEEAVTRALERHTHL